MITKLTQAQEKRLVEVRNEWLAIGRDTKPLDRPRASAAIGAMYRAINKPAPVVLFFDSPLLCVLGRKAIITKVPMENIESNLWNNLRSNLGRNLERNIQSNLEIWSDIESNLRSNIEKNLERNLRSHLRSNLWNDLRNKEKESYFAGAHWCAWEVFYDFCNEIGVPYSNEDRRTLDLWIEQSKACHWWWPYEGICFASERHSTCEVDDQGRIHGGVTYKDGWGVYAWHGVRVPRYVIDEPSKITVAEIEAEQNAEVRRVLIERYGQGRYLMDSGAKEVDRYTDSHGKSVVLLRKEVQRDEAIVMLDMTNSTPEPDGTFKQYQLRVPPTMRKAREAMAWTWNVPENDYAPLVET